MKLYLKFFKDIKCMKYYYYNVYLVMWYLMGFMSLWSIFIVVMQGFWVLLISCDIVMVG